MMRRTNDNRKPTPTDLDELLRSARPEPPLLASSRADAILEHALRSTERRPRRQPLALAGAVGLAAMAILMLRPTPSHRAQVATLPRVTIVQPILHTGHPKSVVVPVKQNAVFRHVYSGYRSYRLRSARWRRRSDEAVPTGPIGAGPAERPEPQEEISQMLVVVAPEPPAVQATVEKIDATGGGTATAAASESLNQNTTGVVQCAVSEASDGSTNINQVSVLGDAASDGPYLRVETTSAANAGGEKP